MDIFYEEPSWLNTEQQGDKLGHNPMRNPVKGQRCRQEVERMRKLVQNKVERDGTEERENGERK